MTPRELQAAIDTLLPKQSAAPERLTLTGLMTRFPDIQLKP